MVDVLRITSQFNENINISSYFSVLGMNKVNER
jgi:hypothetical protein